MTDFKTLIQNQINICDEEIKQIKANYETALREKEIQKSTLVDLLQQGSTQTSTTTTVRLKAPKPRRSTKPVKSVKAPSQPISITDNMIDIEQTKDLSTYDKAKRPRNDAYLLCLTNNNAWKSFSAWHRAAGFTYGGYGSVHYNNGILTLNNHEFKWFVPKTNIPIEIDGIIYDDVHACATTLGFNETDIVDALICGNTELHAHYA